MSEKSEATVAIQQFKTLRLASLKTFLKTVKEQTKKLKTRAVYFSHFQSLKLRFTNTKSFPFRLLFTKFTATIAVYHTRTAPKRETPFRALLFGLLSIARPFLIGQRFLSGAFQTGPLLVERPHLSRSL